VSEAATVSTAIKWHSSLNKKCTVDMKWRGPSTTHALVVSKGQYSLRRYEHSGVRQSGSNCQNLLSAHGLDPMRFANAPLLGICDELSIVVVP
jgi:hypothetical protein